MKLKFRIILELTEDQIKDLKNIILGYRDLGKVGGGWQSSSLKQLSQIVSEEIDREIDKNKKIMLMAREHKSFKANLELIKYTKRSDIPTPQVIADEALKLMADIRQQYENT